ncbi:Heat shock protein HSP 90-alpha 1 [Aduncisulcus paluster]|uniref:Heat shock protein HSP 90-alpha 1 n=1 Tax=Aduncisulcus paluster TaxID=2918883 RepID=A0ABQ5KRG4_9EUKA|nr:Heat shock protein HSP 90-alpha 1 [Aduncisulcus paluster]|eukprot:gnl/Carplike_NY0171/135_a188_5337.p1 GENE.gnl/Carplike_NY0171/135_a188_5337~~gnl/Carplike_NY0171/135_a188_5337.p1  ORF type:complete len:720 (-),score=369.10 gnl/Carplike_NY0171/135_a188_5337:63-2222(-)
MSKETHAFNAEITDLLGLIINTFYSHREVFLREIISNASDALDKRKFEDMSSGESTTGDMKIQIIPCRDANQLIIRDTGIGMTKADLISFLGTIARSGTRAFMEAVSAGATDMSLIGQFGVGFFSAYLAADKVKVVSKHDKDEAHAWESEAGGEFTVRPATPEEDGDNILERGTSIVLSLKDDMEEYLSEDRIKELVKKHSQFVSYPIELLIEKEIDVEEKVEEEEEKKEDEEKKEGEEEEEEKKDDIEVEEGSEEEEEKKPKTKTVKKKVEEFERLNTQAAIWTRRPEEVTEEEYKEFFKTLGSEWDEPLAWKHFHFEGSLEFSAILYIPKRAPFDLFDSKKKRNNIKLYVRRVFIMDDCEELCPDWLSFVRGIVDSEDLPLNISRETLQKNASMNTIRKNLIKKVIELFKEVAEDDDKFKTFYEQFGKNVKLGIHEDGDSRKKLSSLLRFKSTESPDDLTSLDDYVTRMKDKQEKIYFIAGESIESIAHSPFVERLQTKGLEVLFCTEAIDEYCIQSLKDFEGKEFQNITKEGLVLPEEEDEKTKREELAKKAESLCEYMKGVLGSKVEGVKCSDRLVDSPVVIVTAEYGWSANLTRIMRNQALSDKSMFDIMAAKKKMEINPAHPIIRKLVEKVEKKEDEDVTKDIVIMLYQTALFTSGFSLEDPATFASSIYNMVASGIDAEELVEEEEKEVKEDEEEEKPVEEEEEDDDLEGVD